MPMSDHEPDSEGPATDIPPSWGFHLLQELHRMEDKLEAKIDATNARIEALDTKFEQKFEALDSKFEQKFEALDTKFEQKFEALDSKFEQKFEALDTKFTQRIDGLQYWYGATLIAIILGFAAVLLTHR